MNDLSGLDNTVILPFVKPGTGSLLLLPGDLMPLWNGENTLTGAGRVMDFLRRLKTCSRRYMESPPRPAAPIPVGDGVGLMVGTSGCTTTWRRATDGIGGIIFDGETTHTELSLQFKIARIPGYLSLSEIQEDLIVQEPPVYMFRATRAGSDILRGFDPMSRLLPKLRRANKWMKIDLPVGRYKVETTFFVPHFPGPGDEIFSVHQLTLRD